MGNFTHILDHNGLYHLTLDYDPEAQQLKVTFDQAGNPRQRFVDNVLDQLNITDRGGDYDTQHDKVKKHGRTRIFKPVSRNFALRMGEESLLECQITLDGTLRPTYQRPLIIDETRRIGSFYQCKPYPRRRIGMQPEENEQLINTAQRTVTTDFHTHSSGQISAKGLIAVAMQHKPYYYPISLLTDAGVDTSLHSIDKKHRQKIKRIPFPPMEKPGEKYPDEIEAVDLHALPKEALEILAAHMAMPADRQSTFTHLEYVGNRFRYPFSKDPRLTAAIRKREAEEYAAQGIDFALCSYVGLDNPTILNIIHDTVEELKANEKTQRFSQRYMAGIPRGLPLPKIEEMLNRAAVLLDSPYVMGVDMLGYESNKTREFIPMLNQYMKWANEHKPGSFIRVHAGENDKNHDNVKDFLKIAVKYPNLHFLVGHGVYGMDEETIDLLKKLGDRVTVEINPTSNIALNNIDDVTALPFAKLREYKIPFIIGSDCAGMYLTDATQLGLSAYNAGFGLEDFADLKKYQERLVSHMQGYSRHIVETFPQWAATEGRKAKLEEMAARLAEVPKAVMPQKPSIDEDAFKAKLRDDNVTLLEPGMRAPELENKYPVTIMGASGKSWERLSKGQKRENAIAIDMLVHVLGDKAYVLQGRPKRVGLTHVINTASSNTNVERKKTKRPELFNVRLQIDLVRDDDDTKSYKPLSHLIHQHGLSLDLPNALVDYTFNHEGVLICVGGTAFTRDTITEADQRGIHEKHPDNRKIMLLLANAEGASAEKAKVLHPDYAAETGQQLISKLLKLRPDLFPTNFKAKDINGLYNESAARIDRQLDGPAIVRNAQLLQRQSARLDIPISRPQRTRG